MNPPHLPGQPRRGRPRARAIALRDNALLVIRRRRHGEDYVVLPGGGIERGESPAAAVVREIGEETGLTARVLRPLWVEPDEHGDIHYFLAEPGPGTPHLHGAELLKHSPWNRYAPGWLALARMDEEPLKPRGIAARIRLLREAFVDAGSAFRVDS